MNIRSKLLKGNTMHRHSLLRRHLPESHPLKRRIVGKMLKGIPAFS